jgi:hypothetical protein
MELSFRSLISNPDFHPHAGNSLYVGLSRRGGICTRNLFDNHNLRWAALLPEHESGLATLLRFWLR